MIVKTMANPDREVTLYLCTKYKLFVMVDKGKYPSKIALDNTQFKHFCLAIIFITSPSSNVFKISNIPLISISYTDTGIVPKRSLYIILMLELYLKY